MIEEKPTAYGYCTRLNGDRVPVYYFYEIEEGKVQFHIRDGDQWVDIAETWKQLGTRPNRPHRTPLEVTEIDRRRKK